MMNPTTKSRSRSRWLVSLSGGLILAAVVIAALVYGPELYSLFQLGRQLEQISRENERLGGPWPRVSDACIACHGFEGHARAQGYPRLAGQPEAYIKKQLKAFASGERSDSTMTTLAVSLSESDIDGLAAFFAKMAPQPNTTFSADAGRVARGEALVKTKGCVACHGQQLEGKDLNPRLAGQGYDYLVDQLTRFKSGARKDVSGAMPAIAAALSQQEIGDMASYLARPELAQAVPASKAD
ncbi:c-type cytochrome [Pelomonas aquatica]|jgi:cytochrome c553|uniref:C-type cytochrome n=1 Tax=Pelomonas aquatica TaxID=431058 RepID=A0A9X4R9P3_9BURK|nr:c-type cytochrome [Pelomonas aquatica]MCY4757132.1 c-type cytochrome [Pelomonas aquatica]MDG0864568.1 c-type cytochrome [Pelomonas aquatica]